jgi:RIO-like serine/threonine protein kinase
VECVLHRGGWGNPDVLLARVDGVRVVVKDFAPRSVWVRTAFGRWLNAREQRALRRLAELETVPALLGALDAHAFVLAYRPGRMLSRSLAGTLRPGFVGELERAVSEMHSRGVVHLDLRHRGNALVGADGRPVLLDFASAICFRPGGPGARWLLPLLACIDRRAVEKWRVRLEP